MPIPSSTTDSESGRTALRLAKYSFGVGDRFAHQAMAQLRACILAARDGIEVVPVWNKSFREHSIVGSKPRQVREAAEAAVREAGWEGAFHIDADHITVETVGDFLQYSDYFTLDIASAIGQPAEDHEIGGFVARHAEVLHQAVVPGLDAGLELSVEAVRGIGRKYLFAVQEAGRIYRHIAALKGEGRFITEVSMDETDSPQTPGDLLVILAALADQGVPLQTIAPKFSGRFNKGIDYVGDPARFEEEFRAHTAVIAHAVRTYGLPRNLKLSVHSGSDKFSLYGAIRRALQDFDTGVHVKTAGTTWLQELTGLAEDGGEGLEMAKDIYVEAHMHRAELCAPYAAVVDIDVASLPSPSSVRSWSAEQYVAALRNDPGCLAFNPSLRQLLHVAFKVAAHLGERFYAMLDACSETIARNVTTNLERHIKQIFP